MMALNTVNMPVTTWGMNALDNRIINHGTSVNNTFRQVAGSLGTGLIVSLSELITRSASAAQTTSEAHVHAQILGVNGAFIFSAVLAGISAILAIIYVRDNESAARIDSTKLPADAHELPTRQSRQRFSCGKYIQFRIQRRLPKQCKFLTKNIFLQHQS
ncbi:hypothetical protein RQN30_06755 [Arcanobacterium hippocoleae]